MKIIHSFISEKLFWSEFAFVMLIQLIPRYFVAPNVPESVFVFGLNSGLLLIYVVWNHSYLRRVPGPVILLVIAHFFACGGYLFSENLADLLEPLRDALFSLAVIGIFSQKYNDSRYIRSVAAGCVILMPLIIWQSVARNNIDLLAQSPTRFGLNLIGYFGVILTYYSLLFFRRGYSILSVIPVLLVILSSSRAAVVGTFFICSIYLLSVVRINRSTIIKTAFFLFGLINVSFVVGLLLYQDITYYFTDVIDRSARIIEFTDVDRIDQWSYWTKYLLDNPSLMGHGLATYSRNYLITYYPHNAYLHMLNGGGLIAGTFYIVACFLMLCTLFRGAHQNSLEFALSRALLLFLLFRGIFEVEMIGGSVAHVVSIFVAYGFGIGLYIKGTVAVRAKATRLRGVNNIPALKGYGIRRNINR